MNGAWVDLFLNPLLEAVIPIILDNLLRLFSLLILALGTWVINFWKNLVIDKWIKNIIEEGVLYAQETFWEEVGYRKFEYAKEYVVKRLSKWYIKIDEDELDVKIQAMVKNLKAEFAELWYNNPPVEE